MKIMHIIPSLTRGGAERLLLTICKGLKDRDARMAVKVTALFDSLELLPQFEAAGIDVECLRVPKKGVFSKLSSLYSSIGRWRPDIVHTHLNYADRYGQIAACLHGVRTRIMSIHNIEPLWIFQEAVTRYCAAWMSTGIVAVSNSVKEECIRRRIAAAGKVSVIYNAPSFVGDRAQPKPHPGAGGPFRLVNVGKLVLQKGQVFAIRAVEMLRRTAPGCILDIYGPDSEGYGRRLHDEIIGRCLEGAVRLNGPIDAVGAALAQAHIYIASSLWEGFHMAVVEAMSHGLPVVATDIAPHRELFGDMPERILVAPGDSEAIAAAVLKLFREPSLYERLSAAGIERAKFFSPQRMIEQYHSLYCEKLATTSCGVRRISRR